MKRYLTLVFAALVLLGCKKDKDETIAAEAPALAFSDTTYTRKTSLPCSDPCANVRIEVPVAKGLPVVADSINNKVFNTVRSIIYFGEKPYDAKTYEEITASFIASYEDLKKDFPQDMIGWEGKVKVTVDYEGEKVLGIKLNHYTFTGGAHGYAGDRSLLFDPKTGKSLMYDALFTDKKAVTALAEKKFREKYKIPAGKGINSTGLMFENEKFVLPQNIFFRKDGLLLLYNTYEVASYAEQQKEILLTYGELGEYLRVK